MVEEILIEEKSLKEMKHLQSPEQEGRNKVLFYEHHDRQNLRELYIMREQITIGENMNDMEWFKEHLPQLREKYESKPVAVLDGEIIAVGDDLEEVARIIERKKRDGEIKGIPYTGRVGDDIAAVHIPSVYV